MSEQRLCWSDSGDGKGICPYCNGSSFWNSWGNGNARCCDCGREFIVGFEEGKGVMVGHPIKESVSDAN